MRVAKRFSTHECLVYEDERWTYARLFAETCAVMGYLQSAGIQKGERVAIAMRNCPEWAAVFLAVTSLGAIGVLLNSWLKAGELEYCVLDANPRMVVCDSERLRHLQQSQMFPNWQVLLARPRELAGQHPGDAIANVTTWERAISPSVRLGSYPSSFSTTDDVRK